MEEPKAQLSLKAKYERLETDRFVFLDRARQCSELTIPTLVPPLGHTKNTKYYTPWQGVGARGVNNLASKLLLSLLPPNSPFFRLQVDDFTLQKVAGTDQARAQVDEALNKVERAVTNEIENTGQRAQIFLAIKHLIVAGNVLVYLPKEGGMRVFCIDSYVVQRDPKGNLLEVIIKEVINAEALGELQLDKLEDLYEGEPVESSKDESKDNKKGPSKDDNVEVYTSLWRDGKNWRMVQECMGKEVPGSQGSWPVDKCPMMALRWTYVAGEDYGRSYVEEYLGDLVSLEALSKAAVEASAQMSKIVWLVSPNGVTREKDLTEAENGDAIVGHKDDVHCLQSEKQADLTVTEKLMGKLEQRLSYAFLLNSSVQRNGERVTAEEIRYMAGELEDALGGVYSVFTQEFQLPLVRRVMDLMQKADRLPKLPENIVTPMIVTGLEALGRGHDLQKYQLLMQMLQPLGPEALGYVNIGDLIKRMGTALMIDMDGLIKTADQIRQEKQQQMQAMAGQNLTDLAGKAAPAAIKAMSDHSMAQQQAQPA